MFLGVQLGSCGDGTTAEDLQQHVIQVGVKRAALARPVYRQQILRVAGHMTKGADDWAELITFVGGAGQKSASAGLKRRHSFAFKQAEVPEVHAQQERATVSSGVCGDLATCTVSACIKMDHRVANTLQASAIRTVYHTLAIVECAGSAAASPNMISCHVVCLLCHDPGVHCPTPVGFLRLWLPLQAW